LEDEAIEHSDVEDFVVTQDYIKQDTRDDSDNENENDFNDASSHSSMNYDSEDSENEVSLWKINLFYFLNNKSAYLFYTPGRSGLVYQILFILLTLFRCSVR